MKQSRWLMITGVTVLAVLSWQVLAGHESHQRMDDRWGHHNYGASSMGWSGHPGYGSSQQWGYGDMAGGMRHGKPQGHHQERGLSRLDLSDKQRIEIRKIKRDSRIGFRKIHNKIADKRDALYYLLEDSKAGKETDKIAGAMGALMAERIKLRIDMRMKINTLLTQTQRQEAREMMFFGRGYGG